ESEVEKVRKEEEAKFRKELVEREARIQADLNSQEEVISLKVKEAENKIAKQRQSLDNEVKKKRQELSVLAAQLQEQHVQMTRKMRKMEEHAERLECEERRIEEIKQKDSLELAERTSVLDVQQQQLQQEFERLNAERETMSFIQLQLEDSRRQLIETTQSLAHSQSEVSFLRNIQQQCTHLRYELDATRLKLDNLTEMQMQKSFESQDSVVQQIKMVDKELQTALPQTSVTRGTAAQTSPEPDTDKSLDMENIQTQQQLQQHQYLTDMLRQVQRENEELRGHTQQQRLRIDELTSHAADLANQLEDAHTAITLLSNHHTPEPGPCDPRLLQPMFLTPGPGTITAPPLIAPPPPPPPPLPPHSPRLTRQVGAGEELNFITPPQTLQQASPPVINISSSSGLSNITHRRESRKKPPRRLMVHSNSNSSDETSPTEEILQEARRRLRKLEEESEAVDRSYQNFRRRHENIGPTASLLFHPVLPPHLQYNNSSFGFGSFTSSQPLYSSATGGSHMPVFSSFNYDNRPSTSRYNNTLFNPLISNTTSRTFSSVYQNERISSTVPLSLGSGIQYRPQPVVSTGYLMGRFTSQPYPGLNSTVVPQSRFMTDLAESRFSSHPSTSAGHPRSENLQPKDSSGGRLGRRTSLTQIHVLDTNSITFSESHNPNTNVTFCTPLKTTMVYTSPQVSSIESPAKQAENNSALKTVQSYTLERPITSAVQNSSRKETGTIPYMNRLQENAASSLQHFPRTDMPSSNQETNLMHIFSTDNNWQLHYELSSHFNSALEKENPIKDSASVEKVAQTNNSESSSIKKLFPTISDLSKSQTTFSEDLHPSGSFILSETTEGESNDYGGLPVCNVSGNTISSSVKNLTLGSTSTDRQSLVQPDVENDKDPNIFSTHNEEMLSEISGSGTQTTVKYKEAGMSESNISIARSSELNLVTNKQNEIKENSPKGNEFKMSNISPENTVNELKNTENIVLSSTTEERRNESLITESNPDNEEPVLIQEIQTILHNEDQVRKINGDIDLNDPKIFESSKPEKEKSESPTDGESEVAISIGDQSKKDDSSKDDFW
ncbi:hypothetical protein L9F63_015437, partial [Diploptera punctata]